MLQICPTVWQCAMCSSVHWMEAAYYMNSIEMQSALCTVSSSHNCTRAWFIGGALQMPAAGKNGNQLIGAPNAEPVWAWYS